MLILDCLGSRCLKPEDVWNVVNVDSSPIFNVVYQVNVYVLFTSKCAFRILLTFLYDAK